jgi:hypothetical protein
MYRSCRHMGSMYRQGSAAGFRHMGAMYRPMPGARRERARGPRLAGSGTADPSLLVPWRGSQVVAEASRQAQVSCGLPQSAWS